MMREKDEPPEWNMRHGQFWRLWMVCGLAMVATTGCFGNGQATPSDKPLEESTAALPEARAGNPSALHQSFHAAFAQEMRPFPNQGESAREIADNLDSILVAVGDKTFAQALLRERPLARSAVRDCMVEGDLERRFPMTDDVFQKAPQNEWPSDLAEEHRTGTEGRGDAEEPPAPDASQ
jgi:hypothetical protein